MSRTARSQALASGGRNSVTIRDVARVAKVHPGTVSRALNEATRALVNPETAERVLKAADELGYRPNRIARGLKTSRSHTIGVLIPDITNPLFPPILRGIEDRLDAAGYTSLIVNTDNDPGREQIYLDAMRARQVDGFISATARLDLGLVVDLVAEGTPLVLVNRSLEDGSVPAVTVDDQRGVRLAVEHALELGHERVGHVAGPQNLSTGHRRHGGFIEAMRAAGIAVPAEQVRFGAYFTEEEGARACAELLDGAPQVTAIVAGNDLMAIGCYDTLEQRGLSCPRDISIVGFNDMPFVDRLGPPLTTVRIPQREIGRDAADLLLNQLAGTGDAPREILLEPVLMVRGSTGPPDRHDRNRPPRSRDRPRGAS
ncbi:MAG: LacI family DNA-binding transcriptional regulator [Solirubrobacterales bacterium]|nr:LacI family DNA-binding transcriptional regulator [Solirubrobacterales bacterium]